AARLLTVSAETGAAAFVDGYAAPGPLHVLRGDGSSIDVVVGLRGGSAPLGAVFFADASSLAAVDGSGVLWRIDAGAGTSAVLSTGTDGLVYGITLDVLADGRILGAQVGSTAVPLPSRVVAIDPARGRVDVLTDAGTAYQPTALDDGSIAYFVSNDDGSTALRRIAGRTDLLVLELGDTVTVDVSRDGNHVAVERGDGSVDLVAVDGSAVVSLGRGARPRFAPTSDRLIVLDVDRGVTRAVDLDGTELTRLPTPFAAWVECPEGCAP
ncbi:MAG: hypothetical protein M3295_10300, partial [Chloroflexota bacterium]|nr:hypothetical protein [Chloroflexota bacterium]